MIKRLLHSGIIAMCLALFNHAVHKDDPHVEPKHTRVVRGQKHKKERVP